ncbi:MAG TPA: hypothetical protein VFA94_04880, partial [Acidimicrobiales bacterium]|nr:hypothetical protein [Acidimicrobiales bacterium]
MPSRNALLLLLGTGAVGAAIAGASGAQSKPLVMGSFEGPSTSRAGSGSSGSSAAAGSGLAPIAEEDPTSAPALVLPIVSAIGPMVETPGPAAERVGTSTSVVFAPRPSSPRSTVAATPANGAPSSPSPSADPGPTLVIWSPSSPSPSAGPTTTTTAAPKPTTTSTTSTTAPK